MHTTPRAIMLLSWEWRTLRKPPGEHLKHWSCDAATLTTNGGVQMKRMSDMLLINNALVVSLPSFKILSEICSYIVYANTFV